ncbi:MAG: FAD-binding protein, partial [Rikenellaceae bacterium]
MSHKITLTLTPKQAADSKFYTTIAAHKVGLKDTEVALLRVVKRSIDARQRQVKVNLTVELFEESDPTPPPIHFDYPSVVGR